MNSSTNMQAPIAASRWPLMICVIVIALLAIMVVVDRLNQPDHFQLQELVIMGVSQSHRNEAIKREVMDALNGNFFNVDLSELEARVENMAWVSDAALRRKWPGELHINIRENLPVAVWQDTRWINTDGDLIDTFDDYDVSALPRLSGDDKSVATTLARYQQWTKLFANAGFDLLAVDNSEPGLWVLQINRNALTDNQNQQISGLQLRVDERNAEQKIRRFIDVFNSSLVSKAPEIASVDLRYDSGFAVTWQQPAESASPLSSSLVKQ